MSSSMTRNSSSESSNRSQKYVTSSSNSAKQQQPTISQVSRTRRNVEEQRHALMKARFGAQASYLKLTVFIILGIALILTVIAFFSTNWLEVERRYYGSKFKKLGLWRMCFNSFSAPDDVQFKKFYVGCRWIFADEYKQIRKFLLSC